MGTAGETCGQTLQGVPVHNAEHSPQAQLALSSRLARAEHSAVGSVVQYPM